MDGERKMFFRHTLENYFSFVRNKYMGMAICILVYLAGSFFFLYKGLELYQTMGLRICAADCYVMSGLVGKRILAGIPSYLVMTLLQTQNSRNVQCVLFMRKRSNIWWKQCLENVLRAFIMTLLETVSVGIYSIFMTSSLLIWDELGSVFWYATEHTITNIHFWQIVLGFSVVSLSIYLFTGMLISFVECLFSSYLAGICVCLVLAFAENFSTLSVLYDRTTIFYNQWLSGLLWENCLWTFSIIIVLVIGGRRFAERKEFYEI